MAHLMPIPQIAYRVGDESQTLVGLSVRAPDKLPPPLPPTDSCQTMRGQRRVVARPVEEMDHDHGSCPFRKMPVEILEMIIGRVHVNDLPQMLLVCRCVRVLSRFGTRNNL